MCQSVRSNWMLKNPLGSANSEARWKLEAEILTASRLSIQKAGKRLGAGNPKESNSSKASGQARFSVCCNWSCKASEHVEFGYDGWKLEAENNR
jgi:hypothetical protein